uniref:NADH-ubiquinone oxidoreductase chain 2 n=1 Tax=Parapolybia tinctipennis TaxID=2592911 RepID=A0A514CQM3_9HYME|nr:NADH dehydrogenase subunit 2 [Parapolybia tinctipennis]
MEINTLLMILFISIQSKNSTTSFNYFIIQSISSLMLIMFLIIKNYLFNNNFINIIIMLIFSMKLSMFPFFIWMPLINMKLNWILIFFMSTTQKLIPLLILNSIFNFNTSNLNLIYWIYLTVMFSSMSSSIMSIKELNLKKILSYSSINHSSWMLFIISIDQSMFYLYFLIYSISMMFFCLMMNKFDINKMNQLIKINLFNYKLINISLSINTLILSALPPFLTFLIKLNSMKIILLNNHKLMIITFSVLSIITLIFYMSIIIKMNFIFLIKNKIWVTTLKLNNNFFSSMLTVILTLNILFLIYQFLI